MSAAIPTQRRRDAGSDTWPRVRLGEVCELVSYRSHQIKQSEIMVSGKYPVVSQSEELIEGYSNSEIAIQEVPLVLFGDHTCCVKLIDFPFVVGADGTKLLKSKVMEAPYLAFALQYLKPTIIDGKYRRHFGDLMERFIPLPPLAIQRRIAAKLDRICDIVAKRKDQLSQLNQLVKSRFVEMFGDVTVNDREWETATLPELGELNRGVSKSRPRNSPELLGGPYPLVQTGDVSNSGPWIKNYSSTYSDKGLAQSRLWKRGTLCITIAANIAQTAILDFDACFPDSVVGFVPNERTDAIFIHYWFSFFQKILEAQAPQVAQKNINLKILSGLKVVEPPLALQREFAAFVEKVDKLAAAVKRGLEAAERLYRQQMQELFGEAATETTETTETTKTTKTANAGGFSLSGLSTPSQGLNSPVGHCVKGGNANG